MKQYMVRGLILLIALLFVTIAMAPLYQIWQDHKNEQAADTVNKETSANKAQLQGTKLSNFTPLASIDKLQEVDTTPGNGQTVKAGDTVTVDYTGAVASTGVIFQSSKDIGQPATFKLSVNDVLVGWVQGIPGMKVGGTRRLLIPAALAYASNPPAGSGIPSNADLVFDVTLHAISK